MSSVRVLVGTRPDDGGATWSAVGNKFAYREALPILGAIAGARETRGRTGRYSAGVRACAAGFESARLYRHVGRMERPKRAEDAGWRTTTTDLSTRPPSSR